MLTKKQQSITATEALPDRATEIVPAEPHAIFGTLLAKAAPEGQAQILFGMGCFGELSGCSGNLKASPPPLWGTAAVLR